jgi:hypothetical protein
MYLKAPFGIMVSVSKVLYLFPKLVVSFSGEDFIRISYNTRSEKYSSNIKDSIA